MTSRFSFSPPRSSRQPFTPSHKSREWDFLASVKSSLPPSPASARTVSPHGQQTKPTLGYLAFSPDGSLKKAPAEEKQDVKKECREEDVNREAAWAARVQRDAELHEHQVALEEAEARKGEEAWVRMGGILRDTEGNRDWTRTKAIREELELREVEAALEKRWERYERGWKGLLESRGPVEFGDIPWPVDLSAGLEDLEMENMKEFFLGGLRVRGCKTTKKERVRASLLRWHPDKMTAVVGRVVVGDVGKVEDGIRRVLDCLQRL